MPINYTFTRNVSRGANGASMDGAISPDGTKVAFVTYSSNLSPDGDTNGRADILVSDLTTGAIRRISTASDGAQGSGDSLNPVFSPDGRKVAFESLASFVPTDTNAASDVYVKDLTTGAIQRVSTASDGAQGNAGSFTPVFSADGTRVAFYSSASNLVAGDTNGLADVFVKNLATGALQRVSTASNGAQGTGFSYSPVMSTDGTKVAFLSTDGNLVAGDTNGRVDVFVKNLTTGAIERVSTAADGAQSNNESFDQVFSPDGTKIAFQSFANNLVAGDTNNRSDIFVKDLVTGAIERISTASNGAQGDGFSRDPVFSPDGTKIAFESESTNLVAGFSQVDDRYRVYIKDLATGLVVPLDVTTQGLRDFGTSELSRFAFSADGTSLVFGSSSTGLGLGGDFNGNSDIFVASLTGGTSGADLLAPLAAGEVVDGAGGNDRLMGSVLDDVLVGGSGADLVQGNAGADRFRLSVGGDVGAGNGATVRNADMTGSTGADARSVTGAAITLDILDGGTGDDLVLGTDGRDVVVYSAPGSAVYAGQSQTARIGSVERFEMGKGADVLSLTTTSATKYATAVTALGGEGDDTLWAGSGADSLSGEADNDYLVGGFGNDVLEGGAGNDLFGFSRNFGTDTVTDFTQGQDQLRIKGFGTTLDSLAEFQPLIATGDFDADGSADDTRIDLSAQGTTIVLRDFTATLTAADFQIVA